MRQNSEDANEPDDARRGPRKRAGNQSPRRQKEVGLRASETSGIRRRAAADQIPAPRSIFPSDLRSINRGLDRSKSAGLG